MAIWVYNTGMTLAEFEALVTETVDQMPDEYGQAMKNVDIAVEVWPNQQDLRDGSAHRGMWLFGLYRGVPQTSRGNYHGAIPDKIIIFAGPILAAHWPDMAAVREQIRSTVLHEIGHHFGMSEEQIRKAERARKLR